MVSDGEERVVPPLTPPVADPARRGVVTLIYNMPKGYQHSLMERWGGLCYVRKERKEMFYLTTHTTHFIYGYMASDIW